MTRDPSAHYLGPVRRHGLTVAVHLLTWDYAVVRVERDSGNPIFVPRSADQLDEFLDELADGKHDHWLEGVAVRRPRSQLRRVPRPLRTRREPSVGVEHEYTVLHQGAPIDFRHVIHGLALDGLRADPVDPNAYRCSWGGVVTADGIEAELATPPVPIGPEMVGELERCCAAGRAHLEDRLGDEYQLAGFSTHLSVTAPVRGGDRLARRWCGTFAPGLMLLMERDDSHGILVRPRPGRLELCGEYAEGDWLTAAVVYAAATTRALVRRPRGFRDLEVQVRLQPSKQRYGHFIARDAFGSDDLYERGRASRLMRRAGTLSAQRQLEETWGRARAALEGVVGPESLELVDRVVHGTDTLPRAGE